MTDQESNVETVKIAVSDEVIGRLLQEADITLTKVYQTILRLLDQCEQSCDKEKGKQIASKLILVYKLAIRHCLSLKSQVRKEVSDLYQSFYLDWRELTAASLLEKDAIIDLELITESEDEIRAAIEELR